MLDVQQNRTIMGHSYTWSCKQWRAELYQAEDRQAADLILAIKIKIKKKKENKMK
jgi:hypothetical protein